MANQIIAADFAAIRTGINRVNTAVAGGAGGSDVALVDIVNDVKRFDVGGHMSGVGSDVHALDGLIFRLKSTLDGYSESATALTLTLANHLDGLEQTLKAMENDEEDNVSSADLLLAATVVENAQEHHPAPGDGGTAGTDKNSGGFGVENSSGTPSV